MAAIIFSKYGLAVAVELRRYLWHQERRCRREDDDDYDDEQT